MDNKALTVYEDKPFKTKKKISLFNEMPRKASQLQKEKKRTFKYVFNKIRLKKCASATISKPFPTYHVAYLGNVVTGWAKGEGCIEKPLTTLWRNYIQSSRPDVNMHLTVSGGGLKAVTKNHGLTEYWAHRLTTCAAPAEFPRIFCWVYRHEGRRLRHELRCHAALCASSEMAAQVEKELKDFLSRALMDFKRDKLSKQNARLSLVNSVQENPSLPRRKILLGTGASNYRPPLECSKSAPKLSSIEEIFGEEEDDSDLFSATQQMYRNILKTYEKANFLFEQGVQYKKNQLNRWRNGHFKPRDASGGNAAAAKTDDIALHRNRLSAICENEMNLSAAEEAKEEKKVDLDFKIGGEVLPALPNVEHAYVNPIISKGLMEQEQVSLVPVGETHADFSSLKVYKKRNFSDGNKDFTACAMFFGENISQLENIFQAHCSFNGDRSEEELSNKMNATLLV